jgi:hypothetical protein
MSIVDVEESRLVAIIGGAVGHLELNDHIDSHRLSSSSSCALTLRQSAEREPGASMARSLALRDDNGYGRTFL